MQPSLLDTAPRFDGPDVTVADDARLRTQHAKVLALMLDGQWRTLKQIAEAVNGSEAGVSARLRDFRKPKFGGYTVWRQRLKNGSGLWFYRLVTSKERP